MSLLLSSDAAQNRTVPKEYNMHVANRDSSNTFIFTEKDLPGYSKMKGTARKGVGNGGFPNDRTSNRTAFRDRSRQSLQPGDKSKRWQPNFRKAIPSKLSPATTQVSPLTLFRCRTDRAGWANSNGNQLLAGGKWGIPSHHGTKSQRNHETQKRNEILDWSCVRPWWESTCPWNAGSIWKL